MKRIQTKCSEDEYGPELSAQSLQADFFPWPRFKVAHRTHEAGAVFDSTQRECRVFVFSGQLEFKNAEYAVALKSGEWADLPTGDYGVSVDAERDADVVYVWDVEAFE